MSAKIVFEPIGTRIVVERDSAEEMSPGGVVIPDASQDRPRLGTVIAVGPGRLQPDGTYVSGQIGEGDRVVLSNFAGDVFRFDGQEYVMAREEDILAILRTRD